jgi:uncharacterized protein (TIGR02118 family)
MSKFLAFYKTPSDVAAFEKAYWDTHVPLVEKVPGLQKIVVNRMTGSPMGEPDFYMVAELHFPDAETMKTAMASPENREAGKNLMSFAKGIVSFAFAEEVKQGASV